MLKTILRIVVGIFAVVGVLYFVIGFWMMSSGCHGRVLSTAYSIDGRRESRVEVDGCESNPPKLTVMIYDIEKGTGRSAFIAPATTDAVHMIWLAKDTIQISFPDTMVPESSPSDSEGVSVVYLPWEAGRQ